jgi:hypothetical protein
MCSTMLGSWYVLRLRDEELRHDLKDTQQSGNGSVEIDRLQRFLGNMYSCLLQDNHHLV